jgi:hypothetical protein
MTRPTNFDVMRAKRAEFERHARAARLEELRANAPPPAPIPRLPLQAPRTHRRGWLMRLFDYTMGMGP